MDYFIIWFAGVLIMGSIIYEQFFSKRAIVRRKLRVMEGTDIGLVQSDEIVKIKGSVMYVGKTLKSPLSHRKCSYYHTHVEEKVSSGKSSSWVDLIEEEIAGDVVLKNGSHYALIDTKIIKSHIMRDKEYSSGTFNDASSILEKYLKQHDEKSTGFFGFNKTLRYYEGILEEGELVAVRGKAKWINAQGLGLKIQASKILLISAEDNEAVYLSDDQNVTIRP